MQLSLSPQRIFVIAFTLVLTSSFAAAQAGTLDPTFGTGGIFISPTERGTSGAVAILSDGKILIAGGGLINDTLAAFLTRLNSDGTIDTTFGSQGFASIENTGQFFAMVVEASGKILVAADGNPFANSGYVELARFNSSGTLDTSFGTGGITTSQAIPFAPAFEATGAIALQSNGDIVVAASSPGVMGRFTSSGQLDTTFGTNGVANLVAPYPTQILVQASGKILVSAGIPEPTPAAQPSIVSRYNSNGSLDTTFAAAGMMATPLSASAMTVDSTGRIVIAGSLTALVAPPAANNVGFGIARYKSNGVIDTTFGTGGISVVNFGSSFPLSGAFAVAIQSSGDIVAGGAAAQGAENLGFNSAFGLTRVTSTGVIDTTFGNNGIVTTTIVTGTEQFTFVTALAIQSDGKIVAAGTNFADEEFGGSSADVARYLSE